MGDAGVPGVVDNWCTHRDMDSVQESSRCKQTKPSLWPTRPAGRIRDHSPVARAGLSPGLAWYAPRAIASRTPVQALAKDQTTGGREIARKGSPQPAAVPRTRHTQIEQALVERTHRERPLTPVNSTQSAVGKWQSAARSTQHRKEVTPHMHTPATTHPQDRHTQWTTAATLALGEPARPAHPDPARTAEPAPAPAPARSWTPDGPARHTDRTPASTALRCVGRAGSVSPGPGNTPRPPPHRPPSLPARTPTDTAPDPATPPRKHATAPSPPPAARPKPTGPQPATLGDHSPLRRRRLQPDPRPARPQPATSGDHSPLRRCRLQPDPNRPGPSQRPRPTTRLFVAAACSPTEDRPGPSQRPRAIAHLFVADRL